jgi:coenzyme Q-binding protein COQ10
VTLDAETPRVTVEYLDGPFQYLDNRWGFEPAQGGCTVDFYISYELKSLMLQLMVGAVFERAFRRFTEAFEQRAHQIYGTPRADAVTPA